MAILIDIRSAIVYAGLMERLGVGNGASNPPLTPTMRERRKVALWGMWDPKDPRDLELIRAEIKRQTLLALRDDAQRVADGRCRTVSLLSWGGL